MIQDEDASRGRGSLKKPVVYGAAALALVTAAWAATSVTFNWKPASPEAAPENLPGNDAGDLSIAEARRRGPSVIDYRRLDERLQRLVQEPNMVGLAGAVVENGEVRVVKGYGVTYAGGN